MLYIFIYLLFLNGITFIVVNTILLKSTDFQNCFDLESLLDD